MEETNTQAPEQTPAKTDIKAQIEEANLKAQTQADELSKEYGCKVRPLVFKVGKDSDIVVGFLKEPPRFMKLRMMDKAMQQPITAASEVLEACLLRKESDPRILSEDPDCDVYFIGATQEVYDQVKTAINLFKKK